MFIKSIIARLCRTVSNLFELQSWGGSYGKDGNQSQWHYFLDCGPAMAIIRDGRFVTIMGLLTMVVVYDSKLDGTKLGKVISCRPLILTLQKGDRLILGRSNVNREQQRLRHSLRYVV